MFGEALKTNEKESYMTQKIEISDIGIPDIFTLILYKDYDWPHDLQDLAERLLNFIIFRMGVGGGGGGGVGIRAGIFSKITRKKLL